MYNINRMWESSFYFSWWWSASMNPFANWRHWFQLVHTSNWHNMTKYVIVVPIICREYLILLRKVIDVLCFAINTVGMRDNSKSPYSIAVMRGNEIRTSVANMPTFSRHKYRRFSCTELTQAEDIFTCSWRWLGKSICCSCFPIAIALEMMTTFQYYGGPFQYIWFV